MPCAGVGLACRSLIRGAFANGYRIDLFASRSDSPVNEPFPLHTYTPNLLSSLQHRVTRHISLDRLRKCFLTSIEDDQVAYLWSSAPLGGFEKLNQRGITIGPSPSTPV